MIVLSLENQDIKIKRFGIALKDAIKNGFWIVVENVHLLKEWPNDLLKLLYVNKLSYIVLIYRISASNQFF